MSNLAALPLEDEQGLTRVVVETPRGSILKIDYDDQLECFFVKRRLPLGIAYPFHFGFLPSTRGGDGDPLDAIVLDDAPASSGLVLACRIVGALKLSQREAGKTVRNDRFIAIPQTDIAHVHIERIGDLAKRLRKEIEEFLVQSVKLEDKKLTFLGWADRRAALKALKAGAI